MNVDISNLMEQAKNLHSELETSKKKVENLTATGESGAGMVSVKINGKNKVLSLDIADELINIQEKKVLIDLLIAAFNNAIDNIGEVTKKEMEILTSMFPFLSSFTDKL